MRANDEAAGKDPRGQLDHTWRFDGLSDAFTPTEDRARAVVSDSDGVRDVPMTSVPHVRSPRQRRSAARPGIYSPPLPPLQKNSSTRGKQARKRCLPGCARAGEEITILTRLIELAVTVAHQAPAPSAAPRLDDARIVAALSALGGKAPLRKILRPFRPTAYPQMRTSCANA